MKTNTFIIITLVAVSSFGLGLANNIDANDIKSYGEGTSFQGHSEGKYGPVGAGGYGSPVPVEKVEDTDSAGKVTKKKPLFQDVTEGTSFQGHSEGKYGPVGAGGYGSPVSVGKVEDTDSAGKVTKKKPLFQDVTEGTSFQGHSEGKYGPEGAGGYGPPDLTGKTNTE